MSDKKRNEVLKGFTTAGLLGYLGYKNISKEGVSGAFSSVKDLETLANSKPELREVGETIRANVDSLKEVMEESKRVNLNNLKDKFVNNIDSFFPEGSEGIKNRDEARAFLSALFDSIREEDVIFANNQESIDDALRRMYDAVSDEQNAKINYGLVDQDRQTLKSFFSNSFGTNEITLERFGKNYQKYINNIELFAAESRKSNSFQSVSGQKQINTLDNIGEFFIRNTNAQNQNIINERFERIQRRFGRFSNNITLKEINEGTAKNASLYAQINLKNGNKIFNIPLHLGTDEIGNIIYRATEELGGSSYVAPNEVIRANKIFSGSNFSVANFRSIDAARANKAVVSFNEYIFDEIMSMSPGRIAGLSQREINQMTAFQRNFGLDAPRSMASIYKGKVSENLYQNLLTSRAMQASNAVVAGIEGFSFNEQKGVVKNLLNFYSNDLIGVSAAQTMTARYEDPFSREQTRLFGSIGIRNINNKKTINAFNAIREYGRLDRALLPQTAREGQMFGRYEAIESITGPNKSNVFGINKNISIVGRSDLGGVSKGGLLGINQAGSGRTVGLNLSGVFVKGSASSRLGLAEGVSYFGGNVVTSTSMPKTVVESGIADTKLMQKLIELSKSKKGIRVGNVALGSGAGDYIDMSIDDFFKSYGNREGIALLGHLDSDFSGIKRRGGLEGFTLSLVEHGQGSGRDKYFLVGQMNNLNKNSKLFSWLVKDSTLALSDSGLTQKLTAINSTLGASVEKAYFGMGANMNNTLLSSTDQLKKSVYNISSGIFGALEMGGVSSNVLEREMKNRVGDDTAYRNRINAIYGTNYKDLAEASVLHRRGAYLDAVVETALKNRGTQITDAQLGYILGSVQEHGARFGYEYQGEKKTPGLMQTRLEKFQKGILKNAAFTKALSSEFVIAAGYGTTGGVHAELGRNLARIEPRFFNYTYTSLRSNFGLSQDEAQRYMSSLLIRQQGIESKSSSLFGMNLSMMSLSPLNEIDMNRMLSSVGDLPSLNDKDLNKLLSFTQGEEKGLVDFLSQNKSGQLIDLANVIDDQNNLKAIKDKLGGRTKIFLPGADTLENFSGFKIRNAGQAIAIENEYNRYLMDLVSSIAGLSEANTAEQFDAHLAGFDASKKLLSNVVGTGIRQSLSGEMLGSGSYMGSGFSFGKDASGGTLFEDVTSRAGLLDAFNKNKGYVLFLDAQAFMDGMGSYQEAVSKRLQSEGFAGDDLLRESRKLTSRRIQDFFFGMYKESKQGPTGLGMRNPNVFITHYLPGVNLMRYDFAQGNQDAMFKFFKENTGKYLTEEGVNLRREARQRLLKQKRLDYHNNLNGTSLEIAQYEKYLADRKALVAAKETALTKVRGAIELDADGGTINEPFKYIDEKGIEVEGTRLKRTGILSPEMALAKQENEEFFENLKAAIKTRDEFKESRGEILKTTGQETSAEMQKVRAVNASLNVGGEAFGNLKSRTSRIYHKTLQLKLNQAFNSIMDKHQDPAIIFQQLNSIDSDIDNRIKKLEASAKSATNDEELAKIKREISVLQDSKKRVQNLIRAKTQVGMMDSSGFTSPTKRNEIRKIFNADFTISSGRYITNFTDAQYQRRGSVSARMLFGTDYSLGDDGRIKSNLEVSRKVRGPDGLASFYSEAYDSVVGRNPETAIDFIRKAKTLDILEKNIQAEAIEGEIEDINKKIKTNNAEIDSMGKAKGIKENAERIALLNEENAELKVKRAELEFELHGENSSKSALEALKKPDEEVTGRVGLRGDIQKLSENVSDTAGSARHANINRRIAAKGILDYYEAKKSAGGDIIDNIGRFYGMNNGVPTRTRAQAESALIDFLSKDPTKSISKATLELVGASLPQDAYRSVTYERSIFDDDGVYKGKEKVTKSFVITPDKESEFLELEKRLKLANKKLADFDVDTHKSSNLYQQALREKDEAIARLDKFSADNVEFEKLRAFTESELKAAYEDRKVQLSPEENKSIYESIDEKHKVDFNDPKLDARRADIIKEGGGRTVLSRIEEAVGSGKIDSFESLFEKTQNQMEKEIIYNQLNDAGEMVEVKSTVGDELDKLFLRFLKHHKEFGAHGGGLVRFPEINITADLVNKSGKVFNYEGRMDLSRMMIGDFDADIYQIYHDTHDILQNRFQKNAANFHGFYKSGAEYLFGMNLIGEGMAQFGERLGVSSITGKESLLEEYSKERILKDVGPIDVQVKSGMLSLVQSASEAAARGEDFGEAFKRVRAGAALVAVAQEVLVIKAKKLDIASNVADNFLDVMRKSFKTGSGEELFNFFQENIFKGTIMEEGGEISARNINFTNLPNDGLAAREIRSSLEDVRFNINELREVFDEMARVGKERNVLALGSDRRTQEIMRSADLVNLRQFNQLLAVGLEGGFIGADGSWDSEKLRAGFRNVQQEIKNSFKMSAQGKGMGAIIAGALAGSYLIGASSSVSTLKPENKFSDMRAKAVETRSIMQGKDHSNVSGQAFNNMGDPNSLNMRPINVGNTYITESNSVRMYGEAPTYESAMGASRQFTSVGGQAFVSVQDNRRPISNNYITRSLRD